MLTHPTFAVTKLIAQHKSLDVQMVLLCDIASGGPEGHRKHAVFHSVVLLCRLRSVDRNSC